jgi:hypothetical protein
MTLSRVLVLLWSITAVALLQGTLAASTFPATDPSIGYLGRTQPASSSSITFDWPGVEIRVTVNAQSVAALFTDSGSTFNVFVDSQLVQILNTTSTQTIYLLVDGLDTSKSHYIRLTKRTEPLVAVTTFNGFVLKGGAETLSAPPLTNPTRKVEWIGDSLTCGYGNEGDSPNCPFTPGTENNLRYGNAHPDST